MADGGDVTEVPGPEETPAGKGLKERYAAAATWVKVAIPVVLVVVVVGVGLLIANAVSDDDDTSTASGDSTTTTVASSESSATRLILIATAWRLAEESTTTTTSTTEAPTTTVAPTTTTVAPTTTVAATTVPSTAPGASSTLPPPATVAPTLPTTTTTVPATTTTKPATTTTKPPATTTTTTDEPTPPTSLVPLPAGEIAESLDAFEASWNAAAEDSDGDVESISSWTEQPFLGHIGSVADLGGNLRLVVLSDGDDGPVAMAVLAWMPLERLADQPDQNEAYREALDVLMTTANGDVTSAQQDQVAEELGLTSLRPPFPDGATASATQGEQQYELRAIVPEGGSDPYTLIGVRAATEG